jgi:hypothetical protein
MDDTERRMLLMFVAINGEATGDCSYEIKYSDATCVNTPIGISCMKDGYECWWTSKEDILFDYITRGM